MMKKVSLLFVFILVLQTVGAQDSAKVLNARAYLDLVVRNHPQVRQSQIAVERGKAQLRKARGAFDPSLEGSWSEKVFDGTNYYDLQDYGLKIPTWFGVEGFVGYNRNSGTYFNPENRTPADGQWQAGVSVPLGQGLWVDKRRTVLRQAQVMRDASFVEQEQVVNDLLLQAGRVYWNWQQQFREYVAFLEAEIIAEEVFEAVKMAYLYGDRAAIDTLEANIQRQNWVQMRLESYLKFQTAGFELETFLWDQQGRPLELSAATQPDTSVGGAGLPFTQPVQPLTAALNNPAYRLIDYRRQQLKYEARWQAERLKPDVRVKLYALNEPVNVQNLPFQGQRVGLDFKFPLFIRDARGSLRLVKLQQETLALDQSQRELSLTNQLAALQLEYDQLVSLIATQFTQVENLKSMLEAEKIRFKQGESSIFIINQREAQLVNGKLKFIQLQNRVQVNLLRQLHLTGSLLQVPN
jgi:outer membrane protein TolC